MIVKLSRLYNIKTVRIKTKLLELKQIAYADAAIQTIESL